VDGQIVHDQSYQAKGLSKDGPSIAVVRLPVAPGSHVVQVELNDSGKPDDWTQHWSETIGFQENHLRVVLFDTAAGFSLY
jgi:hypothetical protein